MGTQFLQKAIHAVYIPLVVDQVVRASYLDLYQLRSQRAAVPAYVCVVWSKNRHLPAQKAR